ncbi:MAG: hypothetical protein BGO55_00660 [Sphingobacteriales bacterium 50-39]|nr:hypothetical protein [Sphingobacteriales bacterium]OJW53626.1 MAG: hypothetical protein BGO55_00660 [Sphingobacteriales bacterium 50-39]
MTPDKPTKPLTLRHQRFIKLMIEVVDLQGQIKAYQKCFPNCKKRAAAETASYRLLKNVQIREAIDAGKREKEETIREAKRQERIRLAQEQVAHEFELDAILSSIATGTRTRKKKAAIWNPENKKFEIIVIEEEPTETDIISAADKLYKRKGSYAPTTLKHEGGDAFLQYMKEVAALKKEANVQQGSPA